MRTTHNALYQSPVEDYGDLLGHLGIDRCHALAFGTGFGLLHAVSAEGPSRIGRGVGVNVYPLILSCRNAMSFPPGLYRAGTPAALFAPRTYSFVTVYATRRAAGAETIADLDRMTGKGGPHVAFETSFSEEFIRTNTSTSVAPKPRTSGATAPAAQ